MEKTEVRENVKQNFQNGEICEIREAKGLLKKIVI